MKKSKENLELALEKVRQGDRRSLARLLTILEDTGSLSSKLRGLVYQQSPGKAYVIGVTGAPGAGKSTLINSVAELLSEKNSVAVIAVDPSSPFSGGAVLGDRIRMADLHTSPRVFVRSMASRGALGGISYATADAIALFDLAGFDYVLVETVGTGQSEVEVGKLSDTTVLVLVPGLGDSIQALKAGILEIADIFVINKADKEGADAIEKDIRSMLSIAEASKKFFWLPPILRTVATKKEGTEELILQINCHREWLSKSREGRAKREEIRKFRLKELLEHTVLSLLKEREGEKFTEAVNECLLKRSNVYEAAKRILNLSE
ncbi:MAG: methylmalonyl Co-A mutase-associated GTPase MeaB [Candidatus Dadabacteria bacterium]|nr:MAG: methylmalonyl Co-A mutase-associated GTPase MeaB [Candidatus Dadabacteria bacterium]